MSWQEGRDQKGLVWQDQAAVVHGRELQGGVGHLAGSHPVLVVERDVPVEDDGVAECLVDLEECVNCKKNGLPISTDRPSVSVGPGVPVASEASEAVTESALATGNPEQPSAALFLINVAASRGINAIKLSQDKRPRTAWSRPRPKMMTMRLASPEPKVGLTSRAPDESWPRFASRRSWARPSRGWSGRRPVQSVALGCCPLQRLER